MMKRKKIGSYIHFYEKGGTHKIDSVLLQTIKSAVNFPIDNFHFSTHKKYSREFFSMINSLIIVNGYIINKPILTKIDIRFIYVKINQNQLRIIDALFNDGSETKKYINFQNNSEHLYSEHSGILNIIDGKLEHFVISTQTNRTVETDNEIYLPTNNMDSYNYHYIIHTHPKTPEVGSRALGGVLYEIPSLSDVVNFIQNSKYGITIGSIVIAPEGAYIIRKRVFGTKCKEPGKNFVADCYRLQKKFVKKYFPFDQKIFYEKIAYDFDMICELNIILKPCNIYIDYYPRRDKQLMEMILPIYILRK